MVVALIQLSEDWDAFGDWLRAQLNVLHATFQADSQCSWKLLNYYIILALLSMAGVPIEATLACLEKLYQFKETNKEFFS